MSIGCYLDGWNGIVIGQNTWIGPRCSLISTNHNLSSYTKYESSGPIVIGDNCWLATNFVILPGVHLGDHTVVAAGAVVSKSFPQGDVLLAGVPARVIKNLEPYQAQG
jgi:acetyltransferase-like isoleucine patch superfamily enzyme